MRKKIITHLMIIQLIFIILIPTFTLNTSGQFLEPTVELSFLDYQKNAEYSGEYAEVTFNGLANVTIISGTRVIVGFTASDTWGSAIVSPASLLFIEDGQQTFSVSVRVSPGEKYNSEGQVRVDADWTVYPGTQSGDCNPVIGTIVVGQYFNFSLSSKTIEKEVPRGSETEFKLTITNNGNRIDSFSINVKNTDDLYDQGFIVELDTTNIEIPMGFSETITIFVQTPSKRNVLNENQIIIEVYSDGGMQKNVPAKEYAYTIKLTEKDSSIPKEFSTFIFLIVILIICLLIIWLWRRRKKKIDF
jgi:hypothetical protein